MLANISSTVPQFSVTGIVTLYKILCACVCMHVFKHIKQDRPMRMPYFTQGKEPITKPPPNQGL